MWAAITVEFITFYKVFNGMASNLSPSEQAKALFANENLRFPALPENMTDHLQPVNEHLFATRELPNAAYGIDSFVTQIIRDQSPEDYAVVGFDGHGINSWAAHYYLVQGPLALFTQLPWGGAYTDENKARQFIDSVYQKVEGIQQSVAQATTLGRIPTGWRLVVLVSSFTTPGWVWLSPQKGSQLNWQRPQQMLTKLEQQLKDLINGTLTLT